MYTSILTIVLLLISSCSRNTIPESKSDYGPEENNPHSRPLTCDSTTSKKFSQMQDEALGEIYEVLKTVPGSCDINAPESSGPCERVSIPFTPKLAKGSSRGQRILIMDSGMQTTAILRYAPRTLDIVEYANDGGKFRTTTKEVRTFRAVKDIYYEIIGGKYRHLPAVLFAQVIGEKGWKGDIRTIKPISGTRLFLNETEQQPFGHGTAILNKLADYNPQAEFVLVDKSGSGEAEEKAGIDFCLVDQGDSVLRKYRSFVKDETRSLMDLIEKHDINFLSFSFSYSVDGWKRRLKELCPDRNFSTVSLKKLFKIDFEEFIKPLFSIPNVIAVQAVDNTAKFGEHKVRANHRMDCTYFPNRVRVGVFGMRDSQISKDGSSDISKIPLEKQSILPCVDLAVNVGASNEYTDNYDDADSSIVWNGCDSRSKCCTHFDPFFGAGMGGRLNASDYSTSYAVPIALSYLVHLKMTMPEGTPIHEIIRVATGDRKNFLKDPIRHRQIEVYRLGNLDSEI